MSERPTWWQRAIHFLSATKNLAAAIEREKKAAALCKWYADSNGQLIAEIDRLKAALKTVGDDYPGSSCQSWCYKQAGLDLPEIPMLPTARPDYGRLDFLDEDAAQDEGERK